METYLLLKPLILFLLFCGYSILEGWREGDMFDKWQPKDKSEENHRHTMWTIQRGVVFITMFIALPNWWVLSLPCVFIFLHDGMYYYTREVIKPGTYPKKWLDHSSTSTSFWSKFETPVIRTVSFTLGVIILTASFFI